MTDPKIIGCLIEATAPRRRKLRGVVLPPAPRSRNGVLRLAIDGKKPIPFKPDEWTITVKAGPAYAYGNLPAEHLATRTMLKTEQRKQPTAAQRPVATYAVRKGYALLYAVADTVPMPALSDKRSQAWTEARTCQLCGEAHARPLVRRSRDGARRCGPCQQAAAVEQWAEQARAAQAESAAWARDVLADPRTLLVVKQHDWHTPRIRIETVGTAFDDVLSPAVIADVRLRDIDDLDEWATRFYADKTPEQVAAWRAKYDGTISKTELDPIAAKIHESRIVAWYFNDAQVEGAAVPYVKQGDGLGDRLALWSGVAPHRTGDWYPEPRLSWSYCPTQFAPYAEHRVLRETGDLQAEIEGLRNLLHLVAEGQPPEPTVGPVVVTR